MEEEDNESVFSNSSAEGDAFRERLEGRDWTYIQRKYQTGHYLCKSCGFLASLIRLDAPLDLIQRVCHDNRFGYKLLNDDYVRMDGVEETLNLTALTIASIFSCDETFWFITAQTREHAESYEKLNPDNVRRKGPAQVFSDIGLIPLPRLRQICEAFPTRCRFIAEGWDSDDKRTPEVDGLVDYLLTRKNEVVQDDAVNSMEKYICTLNCKLTILTEEEKSRMVTYDNQGHLLVLHTLFQLFLSEPFCGDNSRLIKRKQEFIQQSLPTLQFLQDNADRMPQGCAIDGLVANGDSLLHIFLRNVSYRRLPLEEGRIWYCSFTFNLPEREALREFTQWLVNFHPESITVRDSSGCLPIHIAAREGIPVEDILLQASPEGLRENKAGFYPFQLAALSLQGSMHQRENEHLLAFGDDDDTVDVGEWRRQRAVERTFRFLLADPTVLDLSLTPPTESPTQQISGGEDQEDDAVDLDNLKGGGQETEEDEEYFTADEGEE
ncbi:expressed unknown protein [Seminavis robusta]|uniref:Uncharacterized protein n=1 Tax=Seminavis robusta TaxID=568900 RepID=A0A9N8F1H6_9STRA|nr:expressed unknown protein [Seminavis robusta]|eukprot:Sro2798_g337340.1 n/a (494) ;mRNA; f:4426-5907